MKEPDAELIDRAKGGDAAAFSTLVRRYQGLVHAAAFQWSGDRAAAQDIAQETFVAAFTRLGELRNPRSFPAWLYRIARNKAAGWRRALARRASIEAAEDLAAPPEPSAGESRAEQREAAAFGKGIRGVLSSLSDALRVPVLLCYQRDLPTAEAARFLGIREGTLRKRLHDARRKLQARIVEHAEKTLQEYRLPAGFARRCICGCGRGKGKPPAARRTRRTRTMKKKADCGCGCAPTGPAPRIGTKAAKRKSGKKAAK